jgi:hypothetical protein
VDERLLPLLHGAQDRIFVCALKGEGGCKLGGRFGTPLDGHRVGDLRVAVNRGDRGGRYKWTWGKWEGDGALAQLEGDGFYKPAMSTVDGYLHLRSRSSSARWVMLVLESDCKRTQWPGPAPTSLRF